MFKNEDDFVELYRAAEAYAVIAAWAGAGLLALLGDGRARRIDELPGDPRAIRQTIPILAHEGLLVVDGQSVALSHTARGLVTSGIIGPRGSKALLSALTQLDVVIKDGGPVRGPDGMPAVTDIGVRKDDPAAARAFMDMLFRRSEVGSQEVARWLARWLASGARVLDLGGGHGRYGDALRALGFAVTLYDQPAVVELARERYGDALAYAAGDFMADELGGPYDAALLSNIVHGFGPAENRRLLARVAAALVPGGLVVLKDMFLDDHGRSPREAAYFNLSMLLHTREGQTYSLGETRAILAEAGFEPGEHVYVPDARFSLVVGRKR
jgi:hypothetical protein